MNDQFTVHTVSAQVQNKFQAWAEKLAPAKRQAIEAEGTVEHVKAEVYPELDELYGPNTYVVYQARGNLSSHHMVRQMAFPRDIDVEGLRLVLPADVFGRITKTVIDFKALNVEIERHTIPMDALSAMTTFVPQPRFLWKEVGKSTAVKLLPGQLAVVKTIEVAEEMLAKQEA